MRPPFPLRGTWTNASPNWSARPSSEAPGRSWRASINCGSRDNSSPRNWPASRWSSFAARDNQLRAFYNVCRHHAAAVVTEEQGTASILRCPYHGWSYGLDGSLKGAPEFEGVCGFDRAQNGLVPVRVETWEQFVFVNLDPKASPLADFLGGLVQRVAPLNLDALHFFERRSYSLNCNWKVFVDNYLDGGYHVPHLHKALNSVLEYKQYTIENEDRYCLQSSPMVSSAWTPRPRLRAPATAPGTSGSIPTS